MSPSDLESESDPVLVSVSRNVNKPLDFDTNIDEHTHCEQPNGFGADIIGNPLQNTSHFFILPFSISQSKNVIGCFLELRNIISKSTKSCTDQILCNLVLWLEIVRLMD